MHKLPDPSSFGRLAGTLLLLAGLAGTARGQAIDPVRACVVKAGLLLNFLRYTDWPAAENTSGPLVVAFAGGDTIAIYLEEIIARERIGDPPRAVEIRHLPPWPKVASPADSAAFLMGCRHARMLYIWHPYAEQIPWILEELSGSAVLTVSDVPGFASRGGMLGLVPREGGLAFEANPAAIERQRLHFSSKALRLARIVAEIP